MGIVRLFVLSVQFSALSFTGVSGKFGNACVFAPQCALKDSAEHVLECKRNSSGNTLFFILPAGWFLLAEAGKPDIKEAGLSEIGKCETD